MTTDDEERDAAGGYHRSAPPPPSPSATPRPARRPRPPRRGQPSREDIELGRQALPEARKALRDAIWRRTTGHPPAGASDSSLDEQGNIDPA